MNSDSFTVNKKIYLVPFLFFLIAAGCVNGLLLFVSACLKMFALMLFCAFICACEAAIGMFLLFFYKKEELAISFFLAGSKLPSSRIAYSRNYDMLVKHAVDMLKRDSMQNKRQAQYLALQNQINPHFLYNTLEAIRSEALVEGLDTVASMSENLAHYFRYTISSTFDFVMLSDEIQNVNDYFSIQKFRFGERISLDIDIPESEMFQTYRMPKLILQPIVENALIHGIEPKVEGGIIRISAEFTNLGLYIYIEDDGLGMSPDELIDLNRHLAKDVFSSDTKNAQHDGIAVKNVNDRLKLIYGTRYGLTYFSLPNVGTTAEIFLPLHYEK
ncbi:MAG: histidine kinase [Treponema sp.]|nr:histidine kinase [Treponema sp.]